MKIRTAAVSILLASLPLAPLSARASVTNDGVHSQHIKEADGGTSGQNTNSGFGVKTGHIQNDAVTSAKIAAGAVTDAKISGQISASKISSTGLNADSVDGKHAADLAAAVHSHALTEVTGLATALDAKSDVGHDHDAVYQRRYANVVVVAKGGGDFTDPTAAIASITDASDSNPYLVKIMPGIYDLGTSTLYMKEYVDIEGSGEYATVLTGSAANVGGYSNPNGTVNLAGNAELRLLTVTNSGAGTATAIGISNFASSASLTHVTAAAIGADTNIALQSAQTTATLTDVTVSAQGGANNYGVESYASALTIHNMTVAVAGNSGPTYGVNFRGGGSVTVSSLAITATGSGTVVGLEISFTPATLDNITIDAWGGTYVKGVNASGSPQLKHLTVRATGQSAIGAIFDLGSPILTNSSISATATSTGFCRGVYKGSNSIVLRDLVIEAVGSGGTTAAYLSTDTSSTIANVTARASGGSTNYGMYVGYGTGNTILIDHSVFEGATGSIYQEYVNLPKIGASKLIGPVVGNATCVSSYNGSYAALNATCQ